ncbi:MAG: NAD(+)/NADH kinase [Promethearchaeia archaeon]
MVKKAIAIASRMDSEGALKLAKKTFKHLIKKGEVVYLETRIAPKIFPHNGMDLAQMSASEIKFLISFGGDGSILRVAQGLTHQDPPPILGVNVGSVGFLDESMDTKIFDDIEKLLNEQYVIEKCSQITPYLFNKEGKKIKLNSALNEVLIVSSKHSKVLQISVKINGVFLNRSYLDGVIISTAIGSTAYNLSAGGAIVSPDLDVIQITPLNSYARSGLKPIVLPLDSEIEIKLLRPRLSGKIVIDGQEVIRDIPPNSRIFIRGSGKSIKFIRFKDNGPRSSYFTRLRKKIIGTVNIPLDDSPEE